LIDFLIHLFIGSLLLCICRFGPLLVIELTKESTLAVVKVAVHRSLSSYFPCEFVPSLVSVTSLLFSSYQADWSTGKGPVS